MYGDIYDNLDNNIFRISKVVSKCAAGACGMFDFTGGTVACDGNDACKAYGGNPYDECCVTNRYYEETVGIIDFLKNKCDISVLTDVFYGFINETKVCPNTKGIPFYIGNQNTGIYLFFNETAPGCVLDALGGHCANNGESWAFALLLPSLLGLSVGTLAVVFVGAGGYFGYKYREEIATILTGSDTEERDEETGDANERTNLICLSD